MHIISYIIPVFMIFLSCSDSSNTSVLSDASGTAVSPSSEYLSNDDFAEVPTAVNGSFRSLKCDYNYPDMGQKSSDIFCSAMDDEGDLSDIKSLREAQVFISTPDELTSRPYYCDDFTECHWRIHVDNLSNNPNMGALMSAVQVGVSATTDDGSTIRIKAKAEPLITQNNTKPNDCANGVCFGEFNHSCVTTCQLRSMVHDDQKAQAQHSMSSCQAMRDAPYYPIKLDKKIYDWGGKDLSITSTSNMFTQPAHSYMNTTIRNSSSGCYLIYDVKSPKAFRWYYYAYSEVYNPQYYHPQVRRFCYCR